MSKQILNWGILSTARINRVLINALSLSKNDQCYAVASRSAEKGESYAKQWKIPNWHGSYENLLADPNIDIIYNPLPNHLHIPYSIKAMQAGKHVLCEKPIALLPEEIDELEKVSADTGMVVMEAFMYRHHPQTLKVVEMIREGAIGNLQFIRGSFTFSIQSEDDIRLAPDYGGGSIWDVGCYPISYARTIVGEKPTKVLGKARFSDRGVDNSIYGMMEFPSGVIAQFDSGFRSPPRAKMEVVGDQGELLIDNPFKPGEKYNLVLRSNGTEKVIKGKGKELYLGQVENLHACVTDEAEPLISLRDSKDNTSVITALLRSARSGNWEPTTE